MNLNIGKKNIIAYTFAIICLVVFAIDSANAQKINGSDLAISAQGWYGFDIEQTRPNLISYGYMNYEAAVGIQTKPENGNPYAKAFGFPMFDIGISVARAGNFKFGTKRNFPISTLRTAHLSEHFFARGASQQDIF